ncbi:type II toxin-antitoxin system HicA family toxin [Gallibacterium salpingitidis]|uniref:type II toxin-antitoxin system HicA family toxin n=1 Tax=Gallibacterium salpingitidis TaxID=505341 RepID=UPI00082628B1|nr:type II toxin-antitoxin system HicA family toxin [Gallibacterium salpingitidis]
MDSKTIIKLIEADGWYLVNIVGSHHQYKHPIKKGRVTIPHPRKDLGHLEKSIKKQAGL